MNSIITIDKALCKNCKNCIDICPNVIFRWDEMNKISIRPERAEICIKCGQCMAICSSKAIVVDGLSYEKEIFDLADFESFDKGFLNMIISRRSVRSFKDKPVPNEVLDKIVNAISLAPPSFPPIKTELVVVNNQELIKQALPYMIELYEGLMKALNHPVAKFIVKQKINRESYITLKNHLEPMLKRRLPQLKDGTEDTITRHAQAMILFHADRNSENFREDIYIAVTYGMLAAHSIGLGATIIDLIPSAVERNKTLRKLFQIPENNEVVASLILGYPKYKFKRGIKRNLKSVKWL